MAFGDGAQSLERLEGHQDIGLPVGDGRTEDLPDHYRGFHHTASLGHAMDLAHGYRQPFRKRRLPHHSGGEQGPLAAHAGKKDAHGIKSLICSAHQLLPPCCCCEG